MNDIDKTIHRILATVRQINERRLACLDISVSGFGYPLQVTEWLGTGAGEALSIGRQWTVHSSRSMLGDLRKVNIDLMRILAEGKAQKEAA